MRYILPALLILVLVLGYALTRTHQRVAPALPSAARGAGTPAATAPADTFSGESNINICIPLKKPIAFKTESLMRSHAKQWKRLLAVVEKPEWTDEETQTHAYALSDGACSLLLRVSGDMLPRPLLTIAAASGGTLDAAQRATLSRSRGYLLISNVIGAPLAADRVKFAVQVLLSLLRQREALGYVNVSAQRYYAKARLAPYLKSTTLPPATLYTLMSGEQMLADEQTLDVHGMEQFGLPDMEISLAKERQLSYYQAVLSTVALRSIEHNQALKEGVVIQPSNDGTAYKVHHAQEARGSEYGRYGVIILQQR